MSGFGVYVHWPYCAAICPYCDFNVYRARGGDHTPLLDAIIADIEAHARRFGARPADSIFLGGGTPSLLRGGEVARIVDTVARVYGLADDCEITIEANPEDADAFADHAAAGVNRFSVGAQAFDDAALKALGRHHNSAASLRAVEAAAATGQRVSLDLIYAREGQGLDAWRAELSAALTLPVEHLSLYQLTIEPNTAFARRVARGQLTTPGDELAASLYELTQDLCAAAGFEAYEISNHARGPHARARHNLVYWRSGDWIGVGPGAHGRVTHEGARLELEAQRTPADYVDAVRESGVGWITETRLSGEDAGNEVLLMGLRTDEGVEIARVEAWRQRSLNAEALAWLSEQGLVRVEEGRVRLTAEGRILSNSVAAELAL